MFRSKLQIKYTHSGSSLSVEKEAMRIPLEFGVFFFIQVIHYEKKPKLIDNGLIYYDKLFYRYKTRNHRANLQKYFEMDKRLDISTIERHNVLNNRFAVEAIQKALNVEAMLFDEQFNFRFLNAILRTRIKRYNTLIIGR